MKMGDVVKFNKYLSPQKYNPPPRSEFRLSKDSGKLQIFPDLRFLMIEYFAKRSGFLVVVLRVFLLILLKRGHFLKGTVLL